MAGARSGGRDDLFGGRKGRMWRRHDKWRLAGAVAVVVSQRQTHLALPLWRTACRGTGVARRVSLSKAATRVTVERSKR